MAKALSVSHYYAYGMEINDLAQESGESTPYPRLRTTGKETEEQESLYWLDFGPCRYDAPLCRWCGPDPLAEEDYGTSPYAYCNELPTALVDPSGLQAQAYRDAMDEYSRSGGYTGSIYDWSWGGDNGGGTQSSNFSDYRYNSVSNTYSDRKGNVFTAAQFNAMVSIGQLRGTPYTSPKEYERYAPLLAKLGLEIKIHPKTRQPGIYIISYDCKMQGGKVEVSIINTFTPINAEKNAQPNGGENKSWWGLYFYDKVLILSCPWVEKGNAFTPGPLIVKSPEINPSKYRNDRDLIRHEIGHVVTFFAMRANFPLYLITIGVPNVINFQTGLGVSHDSFYTEKIANAFLVRIYGPFNMPKDYPSYIKK